MWGRDPMSVKCDCNQGCQFGNLVAKIGSFGTFSCCLAAKNSDLATV